MARLTRTHNRDVLEAEENMKEKMEKIEAEKVILSDKNKHLLEQIEQLNKQLTTVNQQRKQEEDELKELRQNRELLTQVIILINIMVFVCTVL